MLLLEKNTTWQVYITQLLWGGVNLTVIKYL